MGLWQNKIISFSTLPTKCLLHPPIGGHHTCFASNNPPFVTNCDGYWQATVVLVLKWNKSKAWKRVISVQQLYLVPICFFKLFCLYFSWNSSGFLQLRNILWKETIVISSWRANQRNRSSSNHNCCLEKGSWYYGWKSLQEYITYEMFAMFIVQPLSWTKFYRHGCLLEKRI